MHDLKWKVLVNRNNLIRWQRVLLQRVGLAGYLSLRYTIRMCLRHFIEETREPSLTMSTCRWKHSTSDDPRIIFYYFLSAFRHLTSCVFQISLACMCRTDSVAISSNCYFFLEIITSQNRWTVDTNCLWLRKTIECVLLVITTFP